MTCHVQQRAIKDEMYYFDVSRYHCSLLKGLNLIEFGKCNSSSVVINKP